MNKINIAIDGPCGAGKSTLAKTLAKKLKIHYLDTGSMYRAVAYAAIESGIDIANEKAIAKLIGEIDLHTVFEDGTQKLLLAGKDIMPFIRTPEISRAASDVSALPCVRMKLVSMQREVAKNYDVVLDGRDIGTFVLPEAKYKFYVTADPKERARRRHAEYVCKGINKDYECVLKEMETRDTNDATRCLAPLKQADDAILVDTTNMDIDEVIAVILSNLGQEVTGAV
jgi:cytidylate kinase